MLKEKVRNIFVKDHELPTWYVRKPYLDAKLLVDNYGRPECICASNGKSYVYFEYSRDMKFSMMQQMGLHPEFHFTKYSFPPRWICRVPMHTRGMSDNAKAVIKELIKIAQNKYEEPSETVEEYSKYMQKYAAAFVEKTK